MDTSKEYIEMCKKAFEIQALAKRDSYFADLGYNEDPIFYVPPTDTFLILPPENNRSVWIPRQDQLQDMITESELHGYKTINTKPRIDNLLSGFSQFCERQKGWGKAEIPRYSMEQLWLSFIMCKKYNKKWNGNNWTFFLP